MKPLFKDFHHSFMASVCTKHFTIIFELVETKKAIKNSKEPKGDME